MIENKLQLKFDKVAVTLASCDHQKSKLRTVAGAEGFWVAELRVRQLKIGSKSCFGLNRYVVSIYYVSQILTLSSQLHV